MRLRSRMASSVLSMVCLLTLSGVVPFAGTQPAAPTPPAQPPEQPAPSLRPRMREHFSRGAAIRDAVIRADLDGVRAPATWLAEHPQDDLPPSALPNVREMQRLAGAIAKASDLATAARGMAQLAAACGACHTVVEATPTLLASSPRGEDETLAGHMRKHYRAADLLYRGLVVPSTRSWNLGADALTGDPIELELTRKSMPGPDPEIAALARQLHSLAQTARNAETPKARSEVYGQMLATCSDCHKRQNVVIRENAPRG